MAPSATRSPRLFRALRRAALLSLIALLLATGIEAFNVLSTLQYGRQAATQITGINGQIFLQSADAPMEDYGAIVAAVEKLHGVKRAIPIVEGVAGVSSASSQTAALVRGIGEKDLRALPGIAGFEGSLDSFETAGGAVIGEGLAATLGLRVGDTIVVLSAKSPRAPMINMPRIKSYPVAAVFRADLPQIDDLFVFMPLSEAQAFFDRAHEATAVELFLTSDEDVDEARRAIERSTARPVVLTDWRERNTTFLDALHSELRDKLVVFALMLFATAGLAPVVYLGFRSGGNS